MHQLPDHQESVMDGQTYYRRHGWSGCEGSAWDTLTPATKAAWAAAARELTRHRELTRALGFGDDVMEPMAPNSVIVDAWEGAMAQAAEWRESEAWRVTCLEAGHPHDEDCWEHDPALRLERAERTLASLLTENEHAVIRQAGELWNALCASTPDGPTRDADLAEAIHHVHALQHTVMANAAARAYPEQYRRLGSALVTP